MAPKARVEPPGVAVLVEVLRRRDASVTAAQVARIVVEVAPGPRTRTSLVAHLQEHPEVVVQGGSRMPKVVAEFLYRCIDHGVAGLTSPACAVCGRPRTLFHTWIDAQRICTSCYQRSRRETCSRCGREDVTVAARAAEGGAICGRCHVRSRPPKECAGCGRLMRVRRALDGLGYCRRCASRRASKEACTGCGRVARVNARTDEGGALCGTCYAKEGQTSGVCDQCGEVTALVARKGGRGGHDRNLCRGCYRHPRRECGVCGRVRRVALRATDSTPDVCPTCYRAPIVECSECGQSGLGRRTTRAGRAWCFSCQAAHRVDALLTDGAGRVRPEYQPLREALLQMDPRSVLDNWGRTKSLTLLGRLLRETGTVTHEVLDAQPGSASTGSLRALLVSAGVLAERDEYLARLRAFCAQRIAEVEPASERHVLARYVNWHVLTGRPVGPDGMTPHQAHGARDEVRSAQRFLRRLTERGAGVATCSQADIDRWAADGESLVFARWLHRHRLVPAALVVPIRPARSAATIMDPDEQLDLARRLLHDPGGCGVEERVAGCLVLLYGQPATRIAQLSTDDLTDDDDGMQLVLGTYPLQVPPPLAELMRQLPISKPFGAARELSEPRWLFPGKRAGRPRHPTSLMRALTPLGIPVRASRNTALYRLVGTVPPAVVASILGLDAGTVHRWAEQAGTSWLRYAPTGPATGGVRAGAPGPGLP